MACLDYIHLVGHKITLELQKKKKNCTKSEVELKKIFDKSRGKWCSDTELQCKNESFQSSHNV